MADEDDFLSRWSRRKRRVAEEEPEAVQPDSVSAEAEPETEEEEAALLERLGLPVPETLGPGDDFQPFMKAGVPGFLRRRALRVLWRSNPVLANLDGLNDYDDDFTSPELTKKVLATAYQVGKGIVSRGFDEAAPDDARTEETSEDPVEPPGAEAAVEKDETGQPDEGQPEPRDEEPAPRPRRMRFET